MSLGGDHGVGAGRIGHPQAGAEVVGVLDAVEHQEERRFIKAVEHVGQLELLAAPVDAGHDALVTPRANHAVEALAVGRHHAGGQLLRMA